MSGLLGHDDDHGRADDLLGAVFSGRAPVAPVASRLPVMARYAGVAAATAPAAPSAAVIHTTGVLRALLAAQSQPRHKAAHLAQAQAHLAQLDPAQHGRLVRDLQGRILAAHGRGGDRDLVHVTPGEMVIPRDLQTPAVVAALKVAAKAAGVDLRRFTVGERDNAINPATGRPEFDDQGERDGLDDPSTSNNVITVGAPPESITVVAPRQQFSPSMAVPPAPSLDPIELPPYDLAPEDPRESITVTGQRVPVSNFTRFNDILNDPHAADDKNLQWARGYNNSVNSAISGLGAAAGTLIGEPELGLIGAETYWLHQVKPIEDEIAQRQKNNGRP